ncbi:F-box protein [Hibiscus syriacus]|uniref:F-box protein n=1 Tax=Hibiscus syriacus TaxID=106335 RepID=A0A6A3D5X3_HIBSY|nr:F-box protein [Hibiscus syriacus]
MNRPELVKSLALKSLPPWATEISFTSKVDNFEEVEESAMSVLDLPDLVLECILERLPPAALSSMAGVCSSLRSRCISDHLWEKHMKNKWGRIIGPAAYREWQWHIALKTRKDSSQLKQGKPKGLMRILSIVRSSWWIQSKVDDSSKQCSLPDDSIMSWFLALETGRFWFPAQVYNRENGHVGFMLSCYDAELSYEPRTDTFLARYPPHGRRAAAIEKNVPWERLRAPPFDTSPHDLHISDCLNELHPGHMVTSDIIFNFSDEWRKAFNYRILLVVWCSWSLRIMCRNIYGQPHRKNPMSPMDSGCFAYLESVSYVGLQWMFYTLMMADTVVLEFNHYTPGSRWGRTTVHRKEHREEGNEADGFYGGIRKLCKEEDISIWKRLWPSEIWNS